MEESKIESFAELGQKFGEAKSQAKANFQKDISAFAEIMRALPRLTVELTKRSLENGKQFLQDQKDRIDAEFGEIDSQALADQIAIYEKTSEKNSEARQWQNAHESRSKVVTEAVRGVDDLAAKAKANLATRKIKMASLLAKGMAFIGKSGKAKEMQAKVAEKTERAVGKEAATTRIARGAAEKGFGIADGVRKGAKSTQEFVVGSAKVAKDGVINTAKTVRDSAVDFGEKVAIGAMLSYDATKKDVKKGALAFGRATYKGVANVAAVGELGLSAIGNGAKFVGGKIVDSVETAKNYTELATQKASLRKAKLGLGVKTFFAEKTAALSKKLSAMVLASQKDVAARTVAVALKEGEMEKSNKEDGAALEF